MPHHHERKEKVCLNCNAALQGRFCHVCGQENLEPKESFWHLVRHFMEDITHFDGKFFTTLQYLLFRPAFLSKEYLKGRRMSYLHPVRLYVFTSFVFFLLFFSLSKVEESLDETASKLDKKETPAQMQETKATLEQVLGTIKDSLQKAKVNEKIRALDQRIAAGIKDSAEDVVDTNPGKVNVSLEKTEYTSLQQYDSAQQKLPEAKRDGWFNRKIKQRTIELNVKYKNHKSDFFRKMGEVFLHKLPQMLFVSLPFFAWMLCLLYFRRKELYFADHGIFTIHLYTATFIFFLIYFLMDHFLPGGVVTRWVKGGILLAFTFYNYKAFRNFYGQGRVKTILKLILLNFLAFFLMLFLIIGLFTFSAFTI